MCPDNDAPATQNPTLAEDDKFRRTIEPAEGPNKDGLANQVAAAHTRDETFTPAEKVETESAIDSAVRKDVDPTMPSPDNAEPDASQEG